MEPRDEAGGDDELRGADGMLGTGGIPFGIARRAAIDSWAAEGMSELVLERELEGLRTRSRWPRKSSETAVDGRPLRLRWQKK
ncbi:hypothetical protein HK405_009763, partial [Cladochytrium tenue]